jgi:hypothetical protein
MTITGLCRTSCNLSLPVLQYALPAVDRAPTFTEELRRRASAPAVGTLLHMGRAGAVGQVIAAHLQVKHHHGVGCGHACGSGSLHLDVAELRINMISPYNRQRCTLERVTGWQTPCVATTSARRVHVMTVWHTPLRLVCARKKCTSDD